MADQNIGTITLEEDRSFLLPKRGNTREEVQSVMVVMDLTFVTSCFCFFAKGENPDVDFKRAQELIDEKAIADAPITSIKEKEYRKVMAVLVCSSNGMDCLSM
jgi:DNA topoisomerase-1